jgi:hypothetical protein
MSPSEKTQHNQRPNRFYAAGTSNKTRPRILVFSEAMPYLAANVAGAAKASPAFVLSQFGTGTISRFAKNHVS